MNSFLCCLVFGSVGLIGYVGWRFWTIPEHSEVNSPQKCFFFTQYIPPACKIQEDVTFFLSRPPAFRPYTRGCYVFFEPSARFSTVFRQKRRLIRKQRISNRGNKEKKKKDTPEMAGIRAKKMEPAIGIEPMTCSLRVNRSTD